MGEGYRLENHYGNVETFWMKKSLVHEGGEVPEGEESGPDSFPGSEDEEDSHDESKKQGGELASKRAGVDENVDAESGVRGE